MISPSEWLATSPASGSGCPPARSGTLGSTPPRPRLRLAPPLFSGVRSGPAQTADLGDCGWSGTHLEARSARASSRAMAGGEDSGDGEPVSVVTVRVQYLEDSDPFACANFPEPRRAPTCSLDGALPLGAQIPALHRLLGAPLKVRGAGKGWE